MLGLKLNHVSKRGPCCWGSAKSRLRNYKGFTIVFLDVYLDIIHEETPKSQEDISGRQLVLGIIFLRKDYLLAKQFKKWLFSRVSIRGDSVTHKASNSAWALHNENLLTRVKCTHVFYVSGTYFRCRQYCFHFDIKQKDKWMTGEILFIAEKYRRG